MYTFRGLYISWESLPRPVLQAFDKMKADPKISTWARELEADVGGAAVGVLSTDQISLL